LAAEINYFCRCPIKMNVYIFGQNIRFYSNQQLVTQQKSETGKQKGCRSVERVMAIAQIPGPPLRHTTVDALPSTSHGTILNRHLWLEDWAISKLIVLEKFFHSQIRGELNPAVF
jgi:hypothetical protein